MAYADYKSRRQFFRGGQPFAQVYYNMSSFSKYVRGHDLPISERRSRSTFIPAPPPPRTNYLKSLVVDPISDGLSLLIKFVPATGFGDAWFSVYRNGEYIESVYAKEDEMSQTIISSFNGKNSIAVLWNGDEQQKNQQNVVDAAESTGQKVKIDWIWEYNIIGNPDSYLSNWILEGLNKNNTESNPNNTRRQLVVEINAGATTVALTITKNDQVVATGSAVKGSSLTLTESNSSGISGTVDTHADITSEDELLYLRLPKSVGIYRGTELDPTSLIDTVAYNGEDSMEWSEPEILAGDVYYYRLRPTSDTDELGSYSNNMSIEVPSVPEAPEDLAYDSGNAAATTLSFTDPNPTAGSSYNLYMKNIDDDIFSVEHPVATAIAGSTTIIAPAVTGYPGIASFILRAELDDIEEKNGQELNIEYDVLGNYVMSRPNNTSMSSITIDDGLSLNVTLLYNPTDENGVATVGQLFTRTPTGTYDFETPDDEQSLTGTSPKTVLLSVTLTAGWYYVTTKAATADGIQSQIQSDETLIYVSDNSVSNSINSIRLIG